MPMPIAEREALQAIARTFDQISESIENFARKEGSINHQELTAALRSIAKSVNQIHKDVSRLTR